MAYTGMSYRFMAYIVMAYMVMAHRTVHGTEFTHAHARTCMRCIGTETQTALTQSRIGTCRNIDATHARPCRSTLRGTRRHVRRLRTQGSHCMTQVPSSDRHTTRPLEQCTKLISMGYGSRGHSVPFRSRIGQAASLGMSQGSANGKATCLLAPPGAASVPSSASSPCSAALALPRLRRCLLGQQRPPRLATGARARG